MKIHVHRGVSPKGQANLIPLQAALIRAYGTHEGSPYIPLRMKHLCVEILGGHVINLAIDRAKNPKITSRERMRELLQRKFTPGFTLPLSASTKEPVISLQRVIVPVSNEELSHEVFVLHEHVAEIYGVDELPLNPIMAGVALGYFTYPPAEIMIPTQMSSTDVDLTPVRFQ